MFVSHGGLLSVQEALYHRTPLVGVPLGNDQKPNILRWTEGVRCFDELGCGYDAVPN